MLSDQNEVVFDLKDFYHLLLEDKWAFVVVGFNSLKNKKLTTQDCT